MLSGNEQVRAYHPDTGALLWSAPGASTTTSGTVVTDGVRVLSAGGFPQKATVCADPSGKEIWRNNKGSYEQSMLVHEGFVYTLTDSGVAYCWRISDGEEMWGQRLKGPVSASPVLVGDVIYQTNEAGLTYVFKAQPGGFELLAENQLGDEAFATLAICGDRIYTRVATRPEGGARTEWFYCIGEGSGAGE